MGGSDPSSRSSLRLLQYDSDLDTESDLPPLDDVIPKEMLKKLKPKEKKRQDIINGNDYITLFNRMSIFYTNG